jgi:hypothetical protein
MGLDLRWCAVDYWQFFVSFVASCLRGAYSIGGEVLSGALCGLCGLCALCASVAN